MDLAKPPSGKLTLFNMYVALSRSSGRGTIQILRDIDVEALTSGHEAELLAEDDRLEMLNGKTLIDWAELEK